tara:strand:+ start:105 stop:365 length:261 start_codon:yes stop_codon:yes gene_type:complete
MTTITVSIPTDCITYISQGGVPDISEKKEKVAKVKKGPRRPNHWKWNNKKEYQAWWYQQNREPIKDKILKRYHEKKKITVNSNEPS